MNMVEYNSLKQDDKVWIDLPMLARPVCGKILPRMTPFGINGFSVVVEKIQLKMIYTPESIEDFVNTVFLEMPGAIDAEFKSK